MTTLQEWLYAQRRTAGGREELESIRKDAQDPTLHPGDVIFCRGTYTTVDTIRHYAPGWHETSPIRNDYEAIEVVTELGSRWHGRVPLT